MYGQNVERGSAFEEVKRRSFSGFGILIKRQAAIRLMSFLANIALARLLAPQIFGVYAIVAFVVQCFAVLGDAGIGAALIQRKEEPDRKELSSVFWLQQMLVWTATSAAILAAPLALHFYPSLPSYGIWLIRAMAVGFALTSLRSVPAILMERNLEFRRIASADIAETVVFYAAATSLAYAGFEVWSFVIAALLRALTGTGVIYFFSDWRPAFCFRPALVRPVLRFGLPYQGHTVLGFIKDAVTPLFVGAYAGAAAVGFVNWARVTAFAPLMLSEAFGRVAFPAFSRIQGDSARLGSSIERSMRSITLIMFPVTALMLALGPEIVRLVFTEKWLPALPAYYLYCSSPLAAGVMLPMYSAILALGRTKTVLKMTGLLLALEWGIGVPSVLAFGFNGIALSQPVLATLFYFVYRRVLSECGVRISVLRNIRAPLAAALLAGLAAGTAMDLLAVSFANAAAAAAGGLLLYLCAVYTTARPALLEVRESLSRIFGGAGQA